MKKKVEIIRITLDPYLETADTDTSNNHWPPKAQATRFELFKQRQFERQNPMQQDQRIRRLEEQNKDSGKK